MTGRRPTSPSTKSFPPPPTTQSSQSHAPLQPSGLREAHTIVASPEEVEREDYTSTPQSRASSSHPSPNTQAVHAAEDGIESGDESLVGRLHLGEVPGKLANETTSLLRKPFEFMKPHAHEGSCDHGTFSPRLQSRPQSVRSGISGYGFGSPTRPSHVRTESGDGAAESRPLLGRLFSKSSPRGSVRSHKKKMSTTNYLAELHGITNTTTM
jgi:hypothetical protein